MTENPRPNAGQPVEVEEIEIGSPWHFKLLLIALVLYLIYRAVQLVIWVIQNWL